MVGRGLVPTIGLIGGRCALDAVDEKVAKASLLSFYLGLGAVSVVRYQKPATAATVQNRHPSKTWHATTASSLLMLPL